MQAGPLITFFPSPWPCKLTLLSLASRQTVDPRAGLLCNHEVLMILRQQRDGRANQIKKLTQQKAKPVGALKRKAYPQEEEDDERDRIQPQDLHTVTFEAIKFLQDPTHPHLRQTTSSVDQLLDKLERLDLTKAERLQIVNLAPSKLVHFVLSIDDFEERFPGPDEREHLLSIVRDHLSSEPIATTRADAPTLKSTKSSKDGRACSSLTSRTATTTHVVQEEYDDDQEVMALDEATRDEVDAANELMDEGMGDGGNEEMAKEIDED
ncbi:BQ2448_1422 [Microbotryum intermedium]|uniref:DNA-directed RNA polymerase III subunit RPC9 n=1 Tax=Microbotryum intermedium TaxID=269621 RepID=A0A238FFV8_9BASI|nr:BQ2448_1422 [Microbotryum intermedium]